MSFQLEEWVFSHYGQENYQPGLGRMSHALLPIKEELQKSRIIIIAGTNGKGETTHRLGQYFQSSHFCSWTSPHIQSISERFSSENGDIPLSELENLVLRVHEICQKNEEKLSYYEFLFLVFCYWAVERRPEYIFLEVGLGGRLDAVNNLDAELVLLTSISRDHQEFLGQRYDQILKEKLGVLRPEAQLISFLDLNYLRERARDFSLGIGGDMTDLEEKINLKPFEFSLRNQFLAYAAFCHLTKATLSAKNWLPSRESLFARGEVLEGKNQWSLFGSHNADGMRKLIQFLHSPNYNFQVDPFHAVVASFSKRSEKDLRVMLKMLKHSGLGEVLVTAFEHPKAYPKEALKDLCCQEGLKFVEDIQTHVQKWTHQKILVVGSYYFLGQLRSSVGQR